MNKTTKGKAKGFTLIEIMIVIAIVAILASLAVPAYNDSVNRARRADAKIALEKAAAMQEQHYYQANQYTDILNDIGGTGGSLSSPEGNYNITVAFTDVANPRAGYLLTATATSAGAMKDEDCYSYSLTSFGQKSAFKKSGVANDEACFR